MALHLNLMNLPGSGTKTWAARWRIHLQLMGEYGKIKLK